MSRTARVAPGGIIFHVLNRGVSRRTLFDTPADSDAFERMLAETLACRAMRLLAFCIMSNHWHLLLWPQQDGDLAAFMRRLTITHVRRWVEFRGCCGEGHVWAGAETGGPSGSITLPRRRRGGCCA